MTQTVLFLAANPINTSRLRLDEEVREVDEGLRRSKQRDNFILQQRWAVRPEDFRRAMLDYEPQIVHFSGHGTGEEGIVLEDNTGKPSSVTGEALQEFFGLFPDVECVVLNACYSEIQAEAIAQSVKYVIGMRQAVGDDAAIRFAVSFYDALGAGKSVEFAFRLACNAIQMAGIPGHLIPTLILKGNKPLAKQIDRNDKQSHKIQDSNLHVTCPYCLTEILGQDHSSYFSKSLRKLSRLFPRNSTREQQNVAKRVNYPETCPVCNGYLPVQYVHDYDEHPPLFLQSFGWSGSGKTVFLSALTFMLLKMSNVWQKYSYSAVTAAAQHKVQGIHELLLHGIMPPSTPLGEHEVYIMLLRNMERWGGRTLVVRDSPGEVFEQLEIPKMDAPFLLYAPITFMFISLPDFPNLHGFTIDMLLNRYINTLMRHNADFRRKRHLIIVFTKADSRQDLPSDLYNYLKDDPIWMAINASETIPFTSEQMKEYVEKMKRVSITIDEWVQKDASGKVLVRLAGRKNIDLHFCITSSIGSVFDEAEIIGGLSPRRVLDPLFWALELS